MGHTAWKLLTPQELVDIKQREESTPDPADNDRAWSCGHCNVHFHTRVSRSGAIEHLRERYDIYTDCVHMLTCISLRVGTQAFKTQLKVLIFSMIRNGPAHTAYLCRSVKARS